MNRDRLRRTRADIVRLADDGLDWVTFSTQTSEILSRLVPFQRSCWHTVDPWTMLLTGSLNQNIDYSGSWLATHEYVLDDVNKWWFLARSGRQAGATSLATHGDLSRSARHRSHEASGIGDELRGSFVADGTYWAAASFLRDESEPWFTEADVRLLASLCEPIAVGFRRALLATAVTTEHPRDDGPGVVMFDEYGDPESISPAAERWIEEMIEVPPPSVPATSKMVQVVAARARAFGTGHDSVEVSARSRVQTRSGSWLLLYGTRLSGGADGRTAVIIQPATPNEVAPLVALAYGLSDRECQVTQLCLQGQSTKQMAQMLGVSPYTVQDHLKSIFDKTGVRSRGELVGRVFLEDYAPRWEELPGAPG
ncbi:helix-turn-helix transcriptional regulator [Frankia sp. Cas3]|uniref:helix-turn-helix transcriptional regulator n=2 Tax=unclassified Frankia TaxID=2632575 RepID=UPI002AD3C0B0|nr:helix-turn-helix transcriptional regulator [Frankia sp. Cas3]